jgi:hypothetical protein
VGVIRSYELVETEEGGSLLDYEWPEFCDFGGDFVATVVEGPMAEIGVAYWGLLVFVPYWG